MSTDPIDIDYDTGWKNAVGDQEALLQLTTALADELGRRFFERHEMVHVRSEVELRGRVRGRPVRIMHLAPRASPRWEIRFENPTARDFHFQFWENAEPPRGTFSDELAGV